MIVVGVAFVGMDGRALRQIQFQVLENLDVGLRSGRQGELHRLAFSAYNQMHPQSVEVATLARDVAPEVHALRVRGIESTATDTDVVAHRDRQGVHYISAVGVSLLEELGQHGEQSLPQVGVYGVKPSVEAALGEHALHVAVLPKKQAGFLDVAAEEGRGYQSDAHNLGGRHPSLRVIAQAHRFGKLFAQAVGGGYGIVHRCPPGLQELGRLRTGRILINPIGGNLGYYYTCSRKNREHYAKSGERCSSPYVQAGWIEDLVWQDVREFLQNPGEVLQRIRQQLEVDEAADGLEERHTSLTKRLAQKQAEKTKYARLYAQELIDEEESETLLLDLKNQIENLRLLISSVEANLARKREDQAVAKSVAAWLMILRENLAEVEQDTDEAFKKRHDVAKLLVEGITVGRTEEGRTKVDITYRFGEPPGAEGHRVTDADTGTNSQMLVETILKIAPCGASLLIPIALATSSGTSSFG